MKLYNIVLFVFCSGAVQGNFLTDAWYQYHANKAYAASNYEQAGMIYTTLLQHDPYDAELNYNMGLVLYGQKEYEIASHYFDRAVQNSKNKLLLKQQALFNLGNTYVEQKKLYEAIGSFSKVLEINSKNDRARHNLEYVKQLLQKQEQKNQQDKNDQQQDNNQDQQGDDSTQQQHESKSDQKKPKDSSAKKQNDQGSKDQRSGDQEPQNEHDSSQQKDGLDKSEKDQESKDCKKSNDRQGDDTSNEMQSKEDVADKLQKSSKEHLKNQSQSIEEDDKKGALSKHDLEKTDKSQCKELSTDIVNDQEQHAELQDVYADQMQQDPKDDNRLDKRAVMVMQKLQEQEDHIQKQLLKMNVSKPGAFGYGQKNW